MEITLAGQTQVFLISIVLGAVLGVCYDLFRIIRVAVRHSTVAVAVEDILFAIICTAATFCCLLATGDGRLRLFLLIGELVGFSLYYCTIGMVVIGAAKGIICVIQKICGFINRIFVRPVVRILSNVCVFCGKMIKKSGNSLKNNMKISTIPLKKQAGLLYNLRKRLQVDGRKKTKKKQEPLSP